MDETHWSDELTFPALLRHARSTYGRAMRSALERAGFDDIPANGLYIIGGLALEKNIALRDLVTQLAISKQGAGQLVDALVLRGYLSRAVDDADRRQLIIALTDRGRAAADVQSAARQEIDAQLAGRVGDDNVHAARRTLGALIDLQREPASADDPSRRSA